MSNAKVFDKGLSCEEFYVALTERNRPLISTRDQDVIKNSRVLVAGCGSIGGAAVMPLIRFGFTKFILADPGAYELNNLNRQTASVDDIGKNKADVLAKSALSVNPFAEIEVYSDGITLDNVADICDNIDIIIDGVDVTTRAGLLAKWHLHEKACELGIPLFTGWDMASTQCIRYYQYRTVDRPFQGKIDKNDVDNSSLFSVLSKIVPLRAVPGEIASLLLTGQLGDDRPFPQLVNAADQFGATSVMLATRILLGRDVPKVVTVDLLGISLPMIERLLRFSVRQLLVLDALWKLRRPDRLKTSNLGGEPMSR